jgi:hypothetical protein
MTTVHCDRCGRDPGPRGQELIPFGGPLHEHVHLCGRCLAAFRHWLQRGAMPDDPGEPEEETPVRLDPRADATRRRKRR